MRILYFSRDYTGHDYRFLSSLVENGYEVYYLRLEDRGNDFEKRPLPEKVVKVSWAGGQPPFRSVNVPVYVNSLKRVIQEIKPDLVHAGPVQSCAFLAALAGARPLVTMSWGSDLLKDADKNLWIKWVTRFTLRRTTILLGDCQAVKNKAGQYGFDVKNTVLFPWGIDLTKFSPQKNKLLRETLGWDNKFIILSLRSWEPIYGVDILVKAFARAVKKNDDLRLILLGDGSQSEKIHSFVDEEKVNEKVFFGGHVPQIDLPGYYQAADLYISASHSDGSSVSLMEALASGLPVLVSDIPGNVEWIEPGKQGWLFKDSDVTSLEEKLLEIESNKGNLQEQAVQSRCLAEQRADWPKNFQKLQHAYDLALKREKG